MNMFEKNAGRLPTSAGRGGRTPAEDSSADLTSLFNYPALGQLFEGADARPLEEMRARLARTRQDLERIVRQGSKEDAERAARAERAVGVTLDFLGELERLRGGAA